MKCKENSNSKIDLVYRCCHIGLYQNISWLLHFTMYCTPSSDGAGFSFTICGVSVVSSIVCICHGKKNTTRSSEVKGSIDADLDEVPLAKSSASTKAVFRPLVTASKAQPAPVEPPPMTSTSNSDSRCRF
uniref:Uncharacterized protein n=1 Tax=Glossina palpalis gambiensis TaxID=67801 RepID=A0A1B0BQV9_9MUSC